MKPRPLLLLLCSISFAAPARGGIVDPASVTLDGYSLASATSGDTLFLAGAVRWIGPLTGGGVPVASADLTPAAGFPRVKGSVTAAAPDGAGGWYIGGQFTYVGGLPRANLAHVQADLSVGPWAPSTNGAVRALVVTASDVYLGGAFGTVNGTPRSRAARVSRATGALASWDPQPNGDVNALASDGATLYVGGVFTTIASAGRTAMAAFDLAANGLLPWNPAAVSISLPTTVSALRCAHGVVYTGGNFNMISGQSRIGAAALDPASGAPRAWNPNVQGGVRAILPIGGTIYLGGGISEVGGVGRACLAAVDTAAGTVLPWAPNVIQSGASGPPTVGALEQVGTDVLAGGIFTHVGAALRKNLVRLDAVTGAPLSPSPNCPIRVDAFATSGTRTFVGGMFSGLGSSSRFGLAAVRISTGTPLAWVPDATHSGDSFASYVTAIAIDPTRVFAAITFFDQVYMRSQIAAYSRVTGAELWRKDCDGVANALARSDTRLLVGGGFTVPGPGLVALDPANGNTVAWGASATGGEVSALLPTPGGLAVGGTFTNAGGQPRARLAMLDLTTGLATSWNPGATGAVRALTRSGSTLYCGGDFLSAGGQPRSRVAAIDLGSGAATSWNPGADGTVFALNTDGTTLYAGGDFGTFAGQPRSRLAAVSVSSGSASSWYASVDPTGLRTLALGGSRVFAGGSHSGVDVEPSTGMTTLIDLNTVNVPTPPQPPIRLSLRVAPQPFHSVARIRFSLPRAAVVGLDLFDMSGRRVARVEPRRFREAGEHSASLERRGLAPGLYLLRVSTPEQSAETKVVVLP
jgi:hypothetical protein